MSATDGTAARQQQHQRYRLSLIPTCITQTFPAEMLHSESRSSGPPTITVTEPERNVLPEENASETTGSIVLGRNPATQIAGAADFLSRRLVEIRLERNGKSTVAVSSPSSTAPSSPSPPPPPPTIVVQPLKELSGILGHQLHLNGEKLELNMNQRRTVESGDVLALFEKYFHYKIKLDKYPIVVDPSDDEDEDNDRKVAAAPAIADGANEEGIDQEEKKLVSEQSKSPGRRAKESMKLSMECPLCSEILSNTQSLNCGHVVCGECATEYGIHAFLESKEELSNKPSSSRQSIVAAPMAVVAAAAASPKDGAASSQSEDFHSAKEHHSESWSGPSNMDKCPQCQKGITAMFPNFSLDSIIMGQVMSGEGEFDLYDIQVYLKKQGKARLTEGEGRSVFRRHPAYLSEYIEGLKKEEVKSASASSSATSKAATSTRKGTKMHSIGEGNTEEEPQKKKARSSTDEIVIDDDSDDNEQEDAKTNGNDNIAARSNEVICIDV